MSRHRRTQLAAQVVVARRSGLEPRARAFLELEMLKVLGFGAGGDRSSLRPGEVTYLVGMARRLAPEVQNAAGLTALSANVLPLHRRNA